MAGALERSGLGECTALIEYLRGRGVTENNLRKMIDDKVGTNGEISIVVLLPGH
jgi:hypothetical protein